MKLHYGVPYWLDCVPRNGTPCYPKHKAHLDVDVAIVGGGLTGCATAYVFSGAVIRPARGAGNLENGTPFST